MVEWRKKKLSEGERESRLELGLGGLNEDVQDAEDGRKRKEALPLGGRRVATTGLALGLSMGDGAPPLAAPSPSLHGH